MDRRVVSLLNDLNSGSNIEPLDVRNQILSLFDQVESEAERVSLLSMLDAVIQLAIRTLQAQGKDVEPLKNALLADKRLLVLKEATGPNQLAEPSEQLRVLEREISAGRMERDEFYDLTKAGAEVLGQQSKKPSLLRRLFGWQS